MAQGAKNEKGVSTHELGIRMWELAEADPRYRRALGATRIDTRDLQLRTHIFELPSNTIQALYQDNERFC